MIVVTVFPFDFERNGFPFGSNWMLVLSVWASQTTDCEEYPSVRVGGVFPEGAEPGVPHGWWYPALQCKSQRAGMRMRSLPEVFTYLVPLETAAAKRQSIQGSLISCNYFNTRSPGGWWHRVLWWHAFVCYVAWLTRVSFVNLLAV